MSLAISGDASVTYMPVPASATRVLMPAFVAALTPRAEVADVAPALPDVDAGRIPVDASCPCCGWPERYLDLESRLFGCVSCSYTSDERDA